MNGNTLSVKECVKV
uniref:Uncharacterized protein n=1 Tax=Anguilla anguilla TaxID=7936 RepID=A0A0E9XWM2_ANGAN